MNRRKLVPLCASAAVIVLGACSQNYSKPSSETRYVTLYTTLTYISPSGVRTFPASSYMVGETVQEYPETIGSVDHFAAATGGDGYYYILDARAPAKWRLTKPDAPCAGQSVVSPIVLNQGEMPVDCTQTIEYSVAYAGVLADGTVVYTGGSDKLLPDERLYPDQTRTSPDGRFTLKFQQDGNLVLYDQNGSPLWDSQTCCTSYPGFAIMQLDGNLVIYNPWGYSVWDSGTAGWNGASVVVQSDGNLVMYSSDGSTSPWQTYTGGH